MADSLLVHDVCSSSVLCMVGAERWSTEDGKPRLRLGLEVWVLVGSCLLLIVIAYCA